MFATRLTLAMAALLLVFGAGQAWAAFPGSNGRIAFAVEKWRPADPCLPDPHGCEPVLVSSTIDTVLPSGRGRRVLYRLGAQSLASESGPAWSPDGRLLAFQQARRLTIIRRDGTRYRRLRPLTAWANEPTWSPDGRRLAFSGTNNWLFSARRDGTGLRRLVAQDAFAPSWSVSGRIAFVHLYTRYGKPVSLRDGLYTVRPDGSQLRRLFGRYGQPDWSPDGSRLALQGHGQIYTLGADGRELRRLTAFRQDRTLTGPVWSPDGKYLAFERAYDLYVMRANGRGLHRVVDAPSLGDLDQPDRPWTQVTAPAWQPLP